MLPFPAVRSSRAATSLSGACRMRGALLWLAAFYRFEDLQWPLDKLAEWVAGGLWLENPHHHRRVEGHSLASLAAWV